MMMMMSRRKRRQQAVTIAITSVVLIFDLSVCLIFTEWRTIEMHHLTCDS